MRNSRPEPAETNPSASESGFSYGLLRVAVAQICQSMGFRGAQHTALEVITDIAARYLKTIAKTATTSANTRGRTQSNLRDIIVALEDLISVQGFPGASRVGPQSLHASAAIKDLMDFVKYTDEIPFAQPLPPRENFNGQGKLREQSDGRWHRDKENTRHVPSWLPALPLVAVPEEEKERRWEEGRLGCLNGGAGREEDERWQSAVKRGENKEIELLGKGKRLKVGFIVGIGNDRAI
ncbi:transcription initiation factor TFIID subunit 8 [Primulina eburnea]|uniref:transcription initiation factor TFIID subunit 8 n=1 Tax=Primulina eburnea TaxID=1245227 RepID=UPI003C6C2E84